MQIAYWPVGEQLVTETVCFCLTCAPEAVDGVAPWIRAGRIVDFYAPRLQSAFREVDSMSAESEAYNNVSIQWAVEPDPNAWTKYGSARDPGKLH